MHRLIIVVTMLLAVGAGAQNISWRTSSATLPKAQYTLHVARDGELYAYSQTPYKAAHRYAASSKIWSNVAEGEFYKLQVISRDLGFALEGNSAELLVKFSDNFTKRITLKDDVSGKPIEARDYAIGPDTTIYVIPTDRNLIIRSKDLGESWDTLPASLGMVYQGIDIDAQHTIYAWNAEAVRSTDGGVTWETICYFHKGDAVVKCIKVGENILVLTQNGILYRGFDTLAVMSKPFWMGVRTGTLLEGGPSSLFYHPTNGYAMYSSDSGRHWDTLRNAGQRFPISPSIACDSTGTVYIAPYDHSEANYIYASTDNGASWDPLTQLFDYFTFIGSDPDSAIYSKRSNTLYTSTSNGLMWEKDSPPGSRLVYSTSMTIDGELLAVCRNDDNDVVLASRRDYGTPWSFTSPAPFQDASSPYLASGRFPSGELWTVDAEGYFSLLETDGTWRNAFVLDVPGNAVVTAGVVDSTTIVVTGYEVIYRSTDKGRTFRRVFDLQKEERGRVVASNFKRCYVLTDSNRLLHSTDEGLTWQLFATPQGGQFTDVVVLPTEAIFLSTIGGVFRNTSGFNNPFVWENVSGEVKGLNVVNLALRRTQRLYAGIMGGNVYFTDLSGSGVIRQNANDALRLYPNPAQDRCYLNGVGESAKVELFDLLGIRVLHTTYHGQLDVSNVPAGVYQIVVDNFRASLVIHR